jgi:hypothetical protein
VVSFTIKLTSWVGVGAITKMYEGNQYVSKYETKMHPNVYKYIKHKVFELPIYNTKSISG